MHAHYLYKIIKFSKGLNTFYFIIIIRKPVKLYENLAFISINGVKLTFIMLAEHI